MCYLQEDKKDAAVAVKDGESWEDKLKKVSQSGGT